MPQAVVRGCRCRSIDHSLPFPGLERDLVPGLESSYTSRRHGVPVGEGARGTRQRPRAGLRVRLGVLRGFSVALDYKSETTPRSSTTVPDLGAAGLYGR